MARPSALAGWGFYCIRLPVRSSLLLQLHTNNTGLREQTQTRAILGYEDIPKEVVAGEPVSRILSKTLENKQVVSNQWSIDIDDRENAHGSQRLRLDNG
jgi:hypothetical protein